MVPYHNILYEFFSFFLCNDFSRPCTKNRRLSNGGFLLFA